MPAVIPEADLDVSLLDPPSAVANHVRSKGHRVHAAILQVLRPLDRVPCRFWIASAKEHEAGVENDP